MLIDIIKAGYESNIEYNNSNDQHILQCNKDKNLESDSKTQVKLVATNLIANGKLKGNKKNY